MMAGILCGLLWKPLPVGLAIGGAIVLAGILNVRRSFLLSESSLIYRPTIGELVVMPLRDIVSIDLTTTAMGLGRPGPGVRITLLGAVTLVYAFDMDNARELVASVARITEN